MPAFNLIASFLQKNWKWIALFALILIALFSVKSCNEYRQEVKNLKAAAHFNDSTANSKIKYWKDQAGTEHAKVENAMVDRGEALKAFDSIVELLHIDANQIQTVSKTTVQVEIHEKLKVDTVFKKIPCNGDDSVYVASEYSLSWRDKWMQVWGNLNGVNDSIHVSGTDTLSRVDYWKRAWFLGAKHYYTDISNSNPHVKVVGYKGIETAAKPKRFSLGASVQAGYPLNLPLKNIDPKRPVITGGLSLQYSLIKF